MQNDVVNHPGNVLALEAVYMSKQQHKIYKLIVQAIVMKANQGVIKIQVGQEIQEERKGIDCKPPWVLLKVRIQTL